MPAPIRVMLEQGRKKTVASAFDWPGWERGGKSEDEALAVLAAYRPRYAKVARVAGLGDEFEATGKLKVVERVKGSGMTDFYTLSFHSAAPEYRPMSEAECERKLALLRASWKYFDRVASKVSAELRKGPRGGGRDRDRIIRHANGAEILEFAPKVGVKTSEDVWQEPTSKKLWAHRERFAAAIRDYNAPCAPSSLDPSVSDPAQRVSHARPRVGDGGPARSWRACGSASRVAWARVCGRQAPNSTSLAAEERLLQATAANQSRHGPVAQLVRAADS